jgi:HK97 family phage portal protein
LNIGGSREIPRPQNYNMLERKYGVSAWVYICTRRKSRDLASAPLRVYERGESTTLASSESPFASLLHRVNSGMTMSDLIQITSLWLDLTGNAFWGVFRGRGGKPVEIRPINPFAVRIFATAEGVEGKYEVWHENRPYPARAYLPGQVGDLIHFKLPNPTSDLDFAYPSVWGVGPLEAGWTLVTTEDDAVKWNRTLVKNDGRPTGVLTSDLDITNVDADAAAARFRDVFGAPEKQGRVLVLGKNLKYMPTAITPKEADYLKTMLLWREQIIALFDLNSAVLGLAQGDTGRRSEAVREYWQGAIISTSASVLLPPINEFLAAEFGKKYEVRQDWSRIRQLQENEVSRSQFIQRYWQMGVPFNVLNERYELGFPDVEGGDVPYPGGYVALAADGEAVPGGPVDDSDPEDEKAAKDVLTLDDDDVDPDEK